jgi:hypothetical protein
VFSSLILCFILVSKCVGASVSADLVLYQTLFLFSFLMQIKAEHLPVSVKKILVRLCILGNNNIDGGSDTESLTRFEVFEDERQRSKATVFETNIFFFREIETNMLFRHYRVIYKMKQLKNDSADHAPTYRTVDMIRATPGENGRGNDDASRWHPSSPPSLLQPAWTQLNSAPFLSPLRVAHYYQLPDLLQECSTAADTFLPAAAALKQPKPSPMMPFCLRSDSFSDALSLFLAPVRVGLRFCDLINGSATWL